MSAASSKTPGRLSGILRNTPRSILAMVVVLLGMMLGFTKLLWPEWQQNPDLSHGFFAPIIFVILLIESRRSGTPRWLPLNPGVVWLTFLSAFAGLLLFAMAGLLAASVSWTHAVVGFSLGCSLCAFLLAGLFVLAGKDVHLVPFNWISLTAIFLWVLVTPLPDGTYARLTMGLQNWVTTSVLHTLHMLGIPARQHGNVIELALTTVGVEEACSGIRSLLSCVYAGFFFAAWQVRRPFARAVLIVIAPVLALAMNFLRSLLLTLLASEGKDISGFWHDTTGFAILAVTAIALAGLAVAFESKSTSVQADGGCKDSGTTSPARRSLLAFGLPLGLTAALAVFYLINSRPALRTGFSVPDLAAILPSQPDSWSVNVPQDLYQFSDILQTRHLAERTYQRTTAEGKYVQLTVYVAYWEPGQASVSRVASHTPDACWPGAGWIPSPVVDLQSTLTLPGLRIASGERRFFRSAQGFPQNVWFWHVHDGRVINYQDPYSVPALIKIALQYGFRRQGDQLFVRVSSNQPWSELADEPLMQEIFANLAPLGLVDTPR